MKIQQIKLILLLIFIQYASALSSTKTDSLYAYYLKITQFLSKDDAVQAQKFSLILDTYLINNKLNPGFSASVKAMSKSKDLSSLRASYSDFSPKFIEWFRSSGYQGKLPAYIYHCPMANNDKGGDWLQDRKGTLNPYFGSQMLRCGSLKKTLYLAKN